MHTPLCGHAVGEPRAYVEAAISKGMTEMGFADHLPLSMYDQPGYAMQRHEVDGYVDVIQSLAREYAADIRILLGGEADFFEETVEANAALLAEYPFDYVIGSVHFVGPGFAYDHPDSNDEYERFGIDEVYVASFDLVAKAAATGLFRVIGHFDLAKKHGHRPVDDQRVAVAAARALRAIAAAGSALELNTAGWRKPVGEAYPSPGLLAEAAELGIPLTFGSDAHNPLDVGSDFVRAVGLARACGYRRVLRLSTGAAEELR